MIVRTYPTARRYEDLRALGRIALREGGRTVAVGVVTAVLDAAADVSGSGGFAAPP